MSIIVSLAKKFNLIGEKLNEIDDEALNNFNSSFHKCVNDIRNVFVECVTIRGNIMRCVRDTCNDIKACSKTRSDNSYSSLSSLM